MLKFDQVVPNRGLLNWRYSFEVETSEILGLAGPTGSGKSSLLSIAAGERSPIRGRVVLDERDVTRSAEKLRAVAGFLPEDLPGPYDLPAKAWLSLWAELDLVTPAEFRSRLERAICYFPLSSEALSTQVAHLSKGEQKKLGLLRLWCKKPRLFVLDHPSAYLDGFGLFGLAKACQELAREHVTILLAEPVPYLLSKICDRVLYLTDGAVQSLDQKASADSHFVDLQLARVLGWS